MDLQKVFHEHPLVFNEDERIYSEVCYGCQKPILGCSYSCIKCKWFYLHKSCVEVPRELHHPLHPKHAFILFDKWIYRDDHEYSKCEVCKEFRAEYTYGCSSCNFNIHNRCAPLPLTLEFEVHNHPLTCFWKLIKFTCDLCGIEGNVVPYAISGHKSCASCLRKVKVIRCHKHPLHLTYSLEVQSNFRFCQLCVQKVDTNYGLYYCSSCDFVAHLNCAMDKRNINDINMLEPRDDESIESKTMLDNEDPKLNESGDLLAYRVKKINIRENGTEIATEIEHFSHEHDLKLVDEVRNNDKCDGCTQAILPPFYSCAKFLNGFTYNYEICKFALDIQCSLITDTLIHYGHEHCLNLSSTTYEQKCSICDLERCQVFRCTTCEFTLDFKCTTLQHITRYLNCKFGSASKFDGHEHPLTLVEATKEHPSCHKCSGPCIGLIYQCAECDFYIHPWCL
ncbi:hypothetical protein ACB092_04G127900 [Castanea dentata]